VWGGREKKDGGLGVRNIPSSSCPREKGKGGVIYYYKKGGGKKGKKEKGKCSADKNLPFFMLAKEEAFTKIPTERAAQTNLALLAKRRRMLLPRRTG